jgi:DNA-binding CsgD family transcriptional regulator
VSAQPVVEHPELRPVERRILRLVDEGVAVDEIGHRFRRSPEFVGRVIELAHLPGRAARHDDAPLRPLERCILGWRERGASHEEIAPRFGRSSGFIARVEQFAQLKLAND